MNAMVFQCVFTSFKDYLLKNVILAGNQVFRDFKSRFWLKNHVFPQALNITHYHQKKFYKNPH